VLVACSATVKASKALSAPEPVATTRNCRPDLVRYIIGFATLLKGIFVRQISLPVRLSNP
jgi:hypothetical protein